ncbi:MAG: (deoxy)nucleoside triphosphate pyrophosphohydrolase [Deltaproteobacteria bacterium]|nr:(deoxy)nucleoside triphosphate pyrophosphohydrolase [Deltaproteobacteria bacterium]
MRPRVRVVAGLFCRGDQVLVQQRPPGKVRGLLWEFPGGKVESGETEAEALVRECAEELGVRVTVGAEVHRHVHAYDDLVVELIIRDATLGDDVVPARLDAERLEWVSIRELEALAFCAADRPFVGALARGAIRGR